mgnify:CR=1 FL=1
MFFMFNFAACIVKYIMSLISVVNLVDNKLAEIKEKASNAIFTNSSTIIKIYVGEPGVIC